MPTGETAGGRALNDIQVTLGLLAGIAALIYVAGGATLGLRLLFSGIPSIPVGNLPRDFLFSLGAAQVVAPAFLLGVMVGLIELGQKDVALVKGHLPWGKAKTLRELRQTYLAFYGAIPFVLITPGLAVAIHHDEKIRDETAPLIVLGAAAGIAVAVWLVFVFRSRMEIRSGLEPGKTDKWGPGGWVALLAGALATAGFGKWMSDQAGDDKYFGVVGAWAVAVCFALFVVWLRSQAGERRRRELRADSAKGVSPLTVILSWCATAVLAVPALIAVTAAWPLSDALVCTQPTDATTYDARGRFVGETKDRVYIGRKDLHRIISVPTSKVTRLVVGGDVADIKECARQPVRPPNS